MASCASWVRRKLSPDRSISAIRKNSRSRSLHRWSSNSPEPARIVHRVSPADDPRQRRPDISKAQEILSWAPRTQLKDGLIRTIAYFEELLTDKGVRAALSASS